MSVSKPTGSLAEWVKTIGGVAAMVATIILIPTVRWAFDMERRVTAIEANRFTSSEALAVYKELSTKADKANVPPREVRATLERLENQLDRLNNLLVEHLTTHNGGK